MSWGLALALLAAGSLELDGAAIYKPYTFGTLAGLAGNSGSDNGVGDTARFAAPAGLAADGAGNVYVADQYNNTIRLIVTDGTVTTFAGRAAEGGFVNGPRDQARFSYPRGVALDSQGNLFVADSGNSTIRRIDALGQVTTLAGRQGPSGYVNATGTNAAFNEPQGLAVDSQGTVYVADTFNHLIRKITPDGVASTLAGLAQDLDGDGANDPGFANGVGDAARFNLPAGVAVDGAGYVYVADYGNHVIRKITPGGEVTTVAGSAGVRGASDGPADEARFFFPSGIAVDAAGNIFVADGQNHTLRRIAPDGTVRTLAGLAADSNGDGFPDPGSADGTGPEARFNFPAGVAVGPSRQVHVADQGNNTVRLGHPAEIVIERQPASQRVVTGAQASFDLAISGTGPFFYAWEKDGQRIPDGTNASLSLVNVTSNDAGSYRVMVTNAVSTAASSNAILTVLAPVANDNFANASFLTGPSNHVEWSNVGATLEPGEPFHGGISDPGHASGWWAFTAPSDGVFQVQNDTHQFLLAAYRGPSLPNLLPVANNSRGTGPTVLTCGLQFDTTAGVTYFVAVAGPGAFEGQASLAFVFWPAPSNRDFAGRVTISPGLDRVSVEGPAARSAWWSWTPSWSGPAVLKGSGNPGPVSLGVFTGVTATNLVPVSGDLSTNDAESRFEFLAAEGSVYQIHLTGPGGEMTLDLPREVIRNVSSLQTTTNADRSLNFTAVLQISSLSPRAAGPLRVRLVARAGFSYMELLGFCPPGIAFLDTVDRQDQSVAVFSLPPPGMLGPMGSALLPVQGRCPLPSEHDDWGQGWGVVAVLEEQVGEAWWIRDTRLLVVGVWPTVQGFNGPGGGVIRITSALGNLSRHNSWLAITIGPPAAVRLGGAWRISPTNYGGSSYLGSYTNYSSNAVSLLVSTTNFTLEFANLPGFDSPSNQAVTLQSGATVPLDLIYRVHPPRLYLNSSQGLGVVGTPATRYRLEASATARNSGAWFATRTNRLDPGTNWWFNPLPAPSATNRFYRVLWLSD